MSCNKANTRCLKLPKESTVEPTTWQALQSTQKKKNSFKLNMPNVWPVKLNWVTMLFITTTILLERKKTKIETFLRNSQILWGTPVTTIENN